MTDKYIVTTTINFVTPALRAYDELRDWKLIVIGDKKTPELKLKNGEFYSWKQQKEALVGAAKMIPWNVIQRRNVGILHALRSGAEVIAVIDDDNIPLPGWGENLCINNEPTENCSDMIAMTSSWTAPRTRHVTGDLVIDPIATNTPGSPLWHRGYPIQLLDDREGIYMQAPQRRIVDVQAGMWNGDPDVDAVCRINALNGLDNVMGNLRFTVDNAVYAPFNTQNTILSRRAAKILCLPYDIGRMDDIWAGYMAQRVLRDVGGHVLYTEPTVYQKRNPHDLSKDLEAEMIGYRHTLEFLVHLNNADLGAYDYDVLAKYSALVSHVARLPFISDEMTAFQRAWIEDVGKMK